MKFFYVIGVYTFCVGIHKTIWSLPSILKEVTRTVKEVVDIIDDAEENKMNEKEKLREYFEIKHKEQKRTMNRIGF